MYLGHLAAGLILKARVREAPLAWLLIATVASDLLCGALFIAGLESAVVHGSLVFGHVEADLGYSHSLLGTLGLALVAALLGARFGSPRIGAALGLAVLSHYVLDVLSHRPDMPLIGFGAPADVRLGTNLPLYPWAHYLLELAWCAIAWAVYAPGNRRLLFTIIALMALYTNTIFGFAPPPAPSNAVFGASMIAIFGITPALLLWATRDETKSLSR